MTAIRSTDPPPYFEITDPAFSASSAQVLAARDASWYARTNLGLAVLRYEEASMLLRDPRLRQGSFAWPAQNGISAGPLSEWWSEMMLSKEGADHRRLRQLGNPAFSRGVLEQMVPGFQALANELIDAFAGRGSCEYMAEFAEPYAARVLCQLLGLGEERWQDLARWSSDLGLAFGVTIRRDLESIETALANLYGVANELIARRRRDPGDDVVSALVRAYDEEKAGLSDRELRAMVTLMIFGGMDTTKNQLGLAMAVFIDHPDQYQLLAERPQLAANAVEELIRFRPTVMWATRRSTEAIELNGLVIAPDTTLHILSYPAGTDPLAIGPASFDLSAKRRPHFGFGGGVHHCIGHWLARIDMREALPLVARRIRNPRYARAPVVRPVSGLTGPVELAILFDTPT